MLIAKKIRELFISLFSSLRSFACI